MKSLMTAIKNAFFWGFFGAIYALFTASLFGLIGWILYLLVQANTGDGPLGVAIFSLVLTLLAGRTLLDITSWKRLKHGVWIGIRIWAGVGILIGIPAAITILDLWRVIFICCAIGWFGWMLYELIASAVAKGVRAGRS